MAYGTNNKNTHIYAKFLGKNGSDFHKERAKTANLEIGKWYRVEHIEMGGSFTDIFLEGYPKSFNSVMFEFAEEFDFDTLVDIDIYRDARFNPYMEEIE